MFVWLELAWDIIGTRYLGGGNVTGSRPTWKGQSLRGRVRFGGSGCPPGAAQQSAGFSESRVNRHNQGRLRGDALVEDWKESRRASRMSTFLFRKVHTIAIRAAQTGVYSF
jgi:hypothetical protein